MIVTFVSLLKVQYHHLDHEPFSYVINIDNNTGRARHATIRIFLGPKYDELGNHLVPDEQRRLMIELDKFHKERTSNYIDLSCCIFKKR